MNHDAAKVKQVAEQIKTKGIKFINLQFTDIMGMVKSVGIPVEMWAEVVDHGLWFDGSSIQGFARIAESDMLLHPDLDTFAVIPWDMDVPTARVISDVHLPSGEPFSGDPRNVLKRALAEAAALGYQYFTGPELEFFLFQPHADGSLVPLTPHDQAGYFDVSTDLAHSVRRQMVAALGAFGITVEALHHEVAVGQHEIDFKYDAALRTADNAVTLRLTMKAIAQRNGLYATFMPKPVAGINGNGMHTHQSLWRDGKNSFADPNDEYGLSQLAKKFIAGQLKHARSLSAIIAPLVNSYKRLVPGYEAPVYLSWARVNRSALIRVPKVSPGRVLTATRIELRCPDPSANPYLAFAVMLKAGLDGISSDLPVPEPKEENLYHLDEAALAQLVSMPGSLGEAIEELKRSELVKATLGDHLFDRYVEARTQEWDEYRINVSQWELDRYLPVY
ncbi:MAG: type I glutamate--ammonia ligase [Chloroflexi bacterium]|nr:type I glutamate--ammonia ligase [Chloroflexota bacterium]MBI3763430.1 type I glutamate--ammonia ligase [Chloroflexota bacterium]